LADFDILVAQRQNSWPAAGGKFWKIGVLQGEIPIFYVFILVAPWSKNMLKFDILVAQDKISDSDP